MKTYLLRFRDQAFAGAMTLSKRTFLPYLIAFIILGVISFIIFVPLFLATMGLSFTGLMEYQSSMIEMSSGLASGADPASVVNPFLSQMNFLYFFLFIVAILIFYAWGANFLFKINDNEIREENNSVIQALKQSFNKKVFTILGFMLLNALMQIAIMILFSIIMGLIMVSLKFAGVIIVFIGFIFLMIFLMRFSLGLPAIIHGDMSTMDAISFSYKKLTWKRSALILLLAIVMMIAVFIMLMVLFMVLGGLMYKSGEISISVIVIQQILFLLIYSVFASFGLAALSTLYFRYSADVLPEEEIEHLVAP